MTTLDEAVKLAAIGLPVFPCWHKNVLDTAGKITHSIKSPRTKNGFKDASTDIARIRAWWAEFPEALIGVPTGKASGLFVVDVDPRGAQWYREHAQRLQPGRIHKTQRGHHLLYGSKVPLGCTTGSIHDGVDTRGDGGYIIWWPAHGREAVGDLTDVGYLPEWLELTLEDIEAKKTKGNGAAKAKRASHSHGGEDRSKDLLRKVGIDVRAGLTDSDIIAKHIAHPHAVDQADPERAVRRCIDRARADYQRQPRQQRTNGQHYNGNAHAKDTDNSVTDGKLKISKIGGVNAKQIYPLWPGFLYRGKVTVLAGIPGEAKSLSALDIVARITVGGPWPVGAGNFMAAPVLLLTAEDDPADTIGRGSIWRTQMSTRSNSSRAFTTSTQAPAKPAWIYRVSSPTCRR